jgi:cardiolipin synthase
MKYRLYTTSHKAWDAMFAAMKAAQKSIYIEMFIFLDDTQSTHNFLKLLKEKAQSGVEVVIIADAYGSRFLSKEAIEELRAAGVEFIYFSHWFRHTHRKIVILDNQIALLGGVNIEEKTRNWRDMQIKLKGKIVKPLLKSFAYAYEMVGGKKENILKYSRLPLVQKIKSWITDNFAVSLGGYHLNEYYKKKIIGAKESIRMVTPYLLPPRWMLALLDDACRRGINVEILIPGDTDVKPLNKVNYLNSCRMSEYGVKVYLLPEMNHAKIMLIDGSEGVIGSQNMDILSFNLNIEAGVFFQQKQLVADLEKVIERWKKESTVFESGGKKVKWSDRLLITILKIFYPIF